MDRTEQKQNNQYAHIRLSISYLLRSHIHPHTSTHNHHTTNLLTILPLPLPLQPHPRNSTPHRLPPNTSPPIIQRPAQPPHHTPLMRYQELPPQRPREQRQTSQGRRSRLRVRMPRFRFRPRTHVYMCVRMVQSVGDRRGRSGRNHKQARYQAAGVLLEDVRVRMQDLGQCGDGGGFHGGAVDEVFGSVGGFGVFVQCEALEQ